MCKRLYKKTSPKCFTKFYEQIWPYLGVYGQSHESYNTKQWTSLLLLSSCMNHGWYEEQRAAKYQCLWNCCFQIMKIRQIQIDRSVSCPTTVQSAAVSVISLSSFTVCFNATQSKSTAENNSHLKLNTLTRTHTHKHTPSECLVQLQNYSILEMRHDGEGMLAV